MNGKTEDSLGQIGTIVICAKFVFQKQNTITIAVQIAIGLSATSIKDMHRTVVNFR